MTDEFLQNNTLLLYSVCFGFCIGLFYECFRFIRLSFPHPLLLVALEDLIFWLIVSFSYLFFTFLFSDGIPRWFSLFGSAVGFWVYLNSLGKLLMFFSKSILNAIRFIIRTIYKLLVFPLVFVFKKITKSLFTKMHSLAIMLKRKNSMQKLKREKKALYRKAHLGFQ